MNYYIARMTDVDELRKIIEDAKGSLANPFTTAWGRQSAEFRLWDASERLAELDGSLDAALAEIERREREEEDCGI